MKKLSIRNKIAGLMIAFGLMVAPAALVTSATTYAAPSCSGVDCITSGSGRAKTSNATVNGTITNVTNVLLFLIGAVAVIMLVIGGFKYVTSNGNADQIKSAKNTVMYAIIGIVVAIMGFAIVRFVVTSLT